MNSLEETDFQECYQAWKSRGEKCIQAGGSILKGATCDSINSVNICASENNSGYLIVKPRKPHLLKFSFASKQQTYIF